MRTTIALLFLAAVLCACHDAAFANSLDLADGRAVCADVYVTSAVANTVQKWLSSPDGGIDARITASLKVSVPGGLASFHSGTTTTCQSYGAAMAFIRLDGTVNGPATFNVLFTVSKGGSDTSYRVTVYEESLLSAAQELIELQYTELNAERRGAKPPPS